MNWLSGRVFRSTLRICALLLLQVATAEAAAESVLLQKVIDDQAIIVRSNGAVYLIEKGVGCLSLWRYEGRRVIVDSPGLFLGIGSKLILPDADQECRIWNSKQIDSRLSPSPTPPSALPRAPDRADDEFSFYDSRGRAAVYIELSDGLTFYLWPGEPVGYLDTDSIFGFNGKHLGWYHDGLVYDHEGGIVVAPAGALREPPAPAPLRSLKELKPLKGLKELKPFKPLFGRTWSEIPARVFFLMGLD